MAFKNYDVEIAVKLRNATGPGAASANSSVEKVVQQATQAVQAGAKSQTDAYVKMNATIEAGRAQFVASQISAAEKAAQGTVAAYVKAGQAVAAEERKLADATIRESKRAESERARTLKAALADAQKYERERLQIMQQNERATEQSAKRAADAQVREAKRAASALANSLGSPTAGEGGAHGGGFMNGLVGGLVGGATVSAITQGLHLVTEAFHEIITIVPEAGLKIFEFIKTSADAADSLAHMSLKTNFSVETLSALSVAGKLVGLEIEGLSKSLGIFDKNLTKAGQGNEQLGKIFKELGVDTRDNEKALVEVFQTLNHMPAGARQAGLAMEVFGRGGIQMLGILKQMDDGIGSFEDKLREWGILIGGEAAEQAHEFNKNLIIVDLQLESVKRRIGQQFLPVAIHMLDVLIKFAGHVGPQVNEVIVETTEYLTNALHGLQAVGDFLDSVTGSATKTATGLDLTGEAIKGVGTESEKATFNLKGFLLSLTGLNDPTSTFGGLKWIADQFEKIGRYTHAPDQSAIPALSLPSLLPKGGDPEALADQITAAKDKIGQLKDLVTQAQSSFESVGKTTAVAKLAQQIKELHLETINGSNDEANALIKEAEAWASKQDAAAAAQKQTEKSTTAIKHFAEMEAALIAKTQTFGEQTHLATVNQEIQKASLEGLTTAAKIHILTIQKRMVLEARELDATEAQKKADDARTKTLQEVVPETQGYIDKLAELNAATGEVGKAQFLYDTFLRKHLALALLVKAGDADAIEAVKKLKDAIDALVHKETVDAATKLIDETTASLAKFQIQVDQLVSGHQATEVEKLVQSLIGEKGLALPQSAFDPLLRLISEAQTNPEAVDALKGMLSMLLSGAPGLAAGTLDATVQRLADQLLRAGQAATPLGRAMRIIADENRRLDTALALSQMDVAVAAGTAAKRYQLVWQQAHNDVVLGDDRATEAIIASQSRLDDAMTLHAPQVYAGVLSHLEQVKTVSQAMIEGLNGAYDKLTATVDASLSKTLHGLGLIKDMVIALVNQLLSRVFQSFLNTFLGGGTGGGAGGRSSGGGLGGFLGGIFGGGGASGGGTGGFAGGGSLLSRLLGGGGAAGAGISVPASSSALGAVGLGSGGLTGLHEAGQVFGGAGGAASGFSLSGLGAGLGAMAPLLGLGLGSMLGGSSMLGKILGGAGGLLAGGAIGALGGFGIFGTGGIAAAGGSLSFLAPLLTNPFTLAAIPLIITAAIIIGKNKARQAAEKVNNQAHLDTLPAIYALLAQAQTGDITVTAAKAAWEQIHQDYLSKISGIKDSKTKRNALLWWDHISGTAVDPGGRTTALWPLIEAAAKKSEGRANIRLRMGTPVFTSGGYSAVSQLIRVRPGEGARYPGSNEVIPIGGRDLGYDSKYMFAPKGTQIINQSEMRNTRGFARGGTVGGNGGELNTLQIDSLELNFDSDGLATAVIKSRHFKTAVIHNVKVGQKENKL